MIVNPLQIKINGSVILPYPEVFNSLHNPIWLINFLISSILKFKSSKKPKFQTRIENSFK